MISFVMEVARSASGRPCNVQVCYGRWAQTPVRLGLDRRAGLSVVPRWGLRRVDLPRPGMTQESVSGQMGSSVLGYVVHACREVYLFE